MIVAVGVGSSVDNNELTQIAIGKQENVVHVDNFDQLLAMIHNILVKFCQQKPPPQVDVDGGYTQWSNWTVCSKTCGGGSKSRKRTCTNPKPQGNGQPCYPSLGEAEENEKCNDKKCDG